MVKVSYITFLPHSDAWLELQQVILTISTLLNAPSCSHHVYHICFPDVFQYYKIQHWSCFKVRFNVESIAKLWTHSTSRFQWKSNTLMTSCKFYKNSKNVSIGASLLSRKILLKLLSIIVAQALISRFLLHFLGNLLSNCFQHLSCLFLTVPIGHSCGRCYKLGLA